MKHLLSKAVKFARPLLAVLIIAAVVYAAVSQWSEVRVVIKTIPRQSLIESMAAILLGSLAAVMSWRALLAEEGHQLSVKDAARIFLVGQPAKYLPGSVWSVVVQMELATRAGVPRARTFTASLCWIGLSLSSALTVGLIGLPVITSAGSPTAWALVAVLPIALACSHPKILTRIVDLLLKLMRKAPLPHQFTWKGIGEAFGWLLVTWVFYGTHLWLLANSLGAPGWDGFVRCLGGLALAMGAGVVFILAPSGAGVREALIVSTLAGVMVRGEALGVALVSRMLFILADIGLAGLAGLYAWRMLRDEPVGEGEPEGADADRLDQPT